VATRFQAHLLEQLLRPPLVLCTRGDARAHLLKPAREPVAQPLQLLEIQQTRASAAAVAAAAAWGRPSAVARERTGGGGDVREAVGHDRSQLVLQPCHLGAQRAPGGELIDLGARSDMAALDDWLLLLAHPASSL